MPEANALLMKNDADCVHRAKVASLLALACTVVLALSFTPRALARPDPGDDDSELGTRKTTPRLRRGPQINKVAVECKIREMTSQLAKEPDNKECRLRLAQGLETLAQYSLDQEDFLNAWRYFEGAAHVLNYPKEKGLKKRADEDAEKAAQCHQARVDFLSKMKIKGWVYVTFNWHKINDLDPKAANEYIQQIGLPVRKNWSVAKRLHNVQLGEFTGPHIIVSFNIHRDGSISDIKLTKSCGRPAIDELALQCVKKVTKEPPLLPVMGQVLPCEAQFAR